MNELHFAHKIRQHLNRSLHELPTATVDRLEAARRHALAHQKIAAHQSVLASAGSFIQHGMENLRIKQLVMALGLIAVIASFTAWQADQQVAEIEAIDSALLADDLPIGALTDKGFDAWLKSTSSH
jgi:hypothetical protein